MEQNRIYPYIALWLAGINYGAIVLFTAPRTCEVLVEAPSGVTPAGFKSKYASENACRVLIQGAPK